MIKAVIMLNNGPLIFIPSLYKLDAFNRRMYVCNLKDLSPCHVVKRRRRAKFGLLAVAKSQYLKLNVIEEK